MTDYLKSIPVVYKVVAVLCTVLIIGFSTGVSASTIKGIPDRVSEVEKKQTVMDNRVDSLGTGMQKIQMSVAQIQQGITLSNCMALAELEGDDWRTCVPH